MGKPYPELYHLLIEPVWNWNDTVRVSDEVEPTLLIEPVWNWNEDVFVDVAFKRALLIEPVWNWNFDAHAGGEGCDTTFNRTSMELKRFRW